MENKTNYLIQILGCITDSETHLAQWKVLYLDEGWIKHSKVLKLYKISSEVDLPKPLAVEVFACNMTPSDSSFDWNPHTSQFVSDLLKGKEIHGKVTFFSFCVNLYYQDENLCCFVVFLIKKKKLKFLPLFEFLFLSSSLCPSPSNHTK